MMQTPVPLAPATGAAPAALLGGKYVLGRELGRGGMSVVFEAQHAQLGQAFAVKLLSMGTNTARKAAFQRALSEARAAARLESEHAVRVVDVGLTAEHQPYVVMEKLVGQDLAKLLKTQGPLSIASAASFVMQACDALAEAHAAGIVHRDLKPSNLFLTRRADGSPCIKVLDFGLVQKLEAPTTSGRMKLVGSPGYASPEQLGMKDVVDARADIWALGCVLYVLVTGRRPFGGENLGDALLSIVSTTIAPMTSPRGEVPHAFEAVVRKCLARDPEHRYPSCADLAEALAPFAGPLYAAYVERIHTTTNRKRNADDTIRMVVEEVAPASIDASMVPSSMRLGGPESAGPESVAPDTVGSHMTESDGGMFSPGRGLVMAEMVRPPTSRLRFVAFAAAILVPVAGFFGWLAATHRAAPIAHAAPKAGAVQLSSAVTSATASGSATPTLLGPLPTAPSSDVTPAEAATTTKTATTTSARMPVAPPTPPTSRTAATVVARPAPAPAAPSKRAANPLTYR